MVILNAILTIMFILRGWMNVDDMLVAGSNVDHIKGLKCQLAHAFSMKDLGETK